MKKIIKSVLLIICLCVFVFSAYNIFKYILEENASTKMNNKLLEQAVSVVIPDNIENKKDGKETLPIKVDFKVLKQKNKDIIGWIYLEDSIINYPVLQSNNNDYYLHRLINGKYNPAGSLFMDYRCDYKLTDRNTIIYGHNMKSDTMFGTLQKYKKQEYYEKNKNIYYFTPEKNYIIKLFAGCTIPSESDIYNLNELTQNRISKLIEKSDFKSDIVVTEEDNIMILSTCSYEYDGARYIVMGVINEV